MMAKLAANQGFNKFMGIAKSFMGWGAIRGAGRGLGRGIRGIGAGQYAEGSQQILGAGRRLGGWATASGFQGGRRAGAIAARMGGAGLGAGATADFLNPWGLGWGD